MDKRTLKQIVDYLNQELKQVVKSWNITIFGLQLKGNTQKNSDIDMNSSSNGFEHITIFERSELIRSAELKTSKKIMLPMDILKVTLAEYKFAQQTKRYQAQLV